MNETANEIMNNKVRYRLVDDGRSGVAAVEFAGAHDAPMFGLPVAPVEPVFEDGERKSLADPLAVREDGAPVRAVIVDAADDAHLAVDPVQALLGVIQHDPVGPLELLIHQHLPVRPVHARALDLW